MRRVVSRAAAWAARLAVPVLAAGALAAASGQTSERELLNSERIERTFGSYGIEVLENGDAVRVSNLYSGSGDDRVTRTFAVVVFSQPLDAEIADEHARIAGGGSIGAVFTAQGWTVEKRHSFFGVLDATGPVQRMMGGTDAETLATHVYVLNVVRPGAEHEYATIVETHHPDYLTLEDVRSIYGSAYEPPITVSGLEALVETLKLAAARMR